MRGRRFAVGASAAVGVAVLFALPIAHAGDAVRALTAAEADTRRVGSCDWRCSFQTIACPTTATPSNPCADPWRTTRSSCDFATRVFGGCLACSLNANKRICAKHPAVDCTTNGSPNQTCGFMKRADCNWTGTACVCPGLPAAFSTDGCKPRDCSSP